MNILAPGVRGYVYMHQCEWTKVKLTKSCRQMTGEMNILIEDVVKGYHQCPFTIECFHMMSRRPYWCPKTMKRRPCLCPKLVLWELNSFLMQTLLLFQ